MMRPLQPEVAEGPRADILACVEATPGIHLRSIERETRLPLGQVLYHLERLERMGLVVSARDLGFRRYFLAHSVGRADKRYLAALRGALPRKILLALLGTPRMSHKELCAALDVAGSTLSFHLQRLLSTGVLARDRVGTMNVYSIAEPGMIRRELIYYRESFRDPAVDAYVRRAIDAMPPMGDASRNLPVQGS